MTVNHLLRIGRFDSYAGSHGNSSGKSARARVRCCLRCLAALTAPGRLGLGLLRVSHNRCSRLLGGAPAVGWRYWVRLPATTLGVPCSYSRTAAGKVASTDATEISNSRYGTTAVRLRTRGRCGFKSRYLERESPYILSHSLKRTSDINIRRRGATKPPWLTIPGQVV